jgi:dipeptidyl aminopeptidase/acylaminoacyl peptidase
MSTDRFERELPDLLAQLAPRAVPDYRNDIVRQTARMRQRPAWTIPERWIPMASITSRLTATPNVPLRLIALTALLIAALIAGGVLIASSRPRLPAPFGPAANGLVAYENAGDIFTADPVTGVAKAVVTGTELDLRPVFSRDGTHMVFERKETGSSGRLIVAQSDGSGPVVVTPEPVIGLDYPWTAAVPSYTFSPDGTEIALWSTVDAGGKLWIAKVDGSGMRQVNLPITVVEAAYRPPNGTELIVTGSMNGGTNGIYAIDAKTGTSRTIVVPAPGGSAGFGGGLGRFSPDGSRLAYVTVGVPDDGPSSTRVHVIGLDGADDVTLPMPAGAVFQDSPAWSNDGTRLAITRGYAQHNEDMALAVLPAVGSGVGAESAHGLTGCCDTILQWSPDDSTILVLPEDLNGAAMQHLLLDPSTLAHVPAPWTGTNPPAWQRTVR